MKSLKNKFNYSKTSFMAQDNLALIIIAILFKNKIK